MDTSKTKQKQVEVADPFVQNPRPLKSCGKQASIRGQAHTTPIATTSSKLLVAAVIPVAIFLSNFQTVINEPAVSAFIFSFKDLHILHFPGTQHKNTQESALPIPSLELGHGILAKAFISWLLEWKAQREAGFTEQRQLPALGSGRITGRCLLGFIIAPLVDPQLDLSFFLKLFLQFQVLPG
ncbi:hypothetical protein V6N12_003316 [Hibiscus sabdariffa]|uniref:Uncharacterized protein n=1 Tax=Hibiscus sabdariffa TaxID=183260 RepID=A0ABR2EBI3_9ROSI